MTLARMTMQKRKIVYAEDIAAIHRDRGEGWAHSALEAGYYSVISVPMLLFRRFLHSVHSCCVPILCTPYWFNIESTPSTSLERHTADDPPHVPSPSYIQVSTSEPEPP